MLKTIDIFIVIKINSTMVKNNKKNSIVKDNQKLNYQKML